jgi:4-diphosphocytidyl-2-C-methyl-D-erythritol kinase
MTISEFAPAKVNLFLHVLGRRLDGYHDLDSLVAFADVGDVVEVSADDVFSISVEGRFADRTPDDDSNLALRAARALGAALGIEAGARIRLTKNLPVAAGIGGGSADAAAVLRGLARMWQIGPSLAFPDTAASLGADVPVCLLSRSARLSGVGDAAPEALPEALYLVLANGGQAVSTADVFRTTSTYGHAAPPRNGEHFVDWLCEQRNDLERAALTLAPAIGATLEALRGSAGCLLARMSGSGATCFGLFADAAAAKMAAANLGGHHPDWWVASTMAR